MTSRATFLGTALAGALLVLPLCTLARQGTPPLSRQLRLQNLRALRELVLTPTDVPAEKADDARIGVVNPLRFAVPTPVQITPAREGTWEQVPGGRLWRLRIVSAGATDLNFGFTTCWLPDGATLHIYSEDEDYFQGPYTARDNKPHGQLWTPVLPGGRAVVELFVPAEARQEPQLVLSQINRGYRDMFHRQKDLDLPKAGSCNIDVICPQADPWRNEIRSVARYSINGSGLCTGTLINNVSNDFKNYFLTANHCGVSSGNAATVVVYWNYESPACGQHGGGSLAQNQSGAIFRAARADVDFTLIELDDVPDSSFRVFYSGWDRSGATPAGAVGIHHPNGDEKSISFANSALTTSDNCIGTGGVNSHWQVVWNSGVTEPGSSGSAIFDPTTHRVVGFLSGGDSSCATPQGPDCYGKVSVAWTGASTSTRLGYWLDPANSTTSVAGLDPFATPLIKAVSASLLSEACTNGGVDPGEVVTMSFALQNLGGSNAANVTATLLSTNGVTSPSAPQNYGALPTNGVAATRAFSFVASGMCGTSIAATFSLKDGANNIGTTAFVLLLGAPSTTFTQRFDSVSIPNLPAGWSNSASGSAGWSTTSAGSQSPPNSAFASDPGVISDSTLTSPLVLVTTTNAQVTFAHHYATETNYDGGILEMSINNGPFRDILQAGGSFAGGSYNATISPDFESPIAGRRAWSGNSGGFVTTIANLPAAAKGQVIRLRWRMTSDIDTSSVGWNLDSISMKDGFGSPDGFSCCHALLAPQIVETRWAGTNIVFSFNTVAGQSYTTEYKSLLSTGLVWTALQTNVGDGTKKSVTNSTGVAAQRFFRVKTQ